MKKFKNTPNKPVWISRSVAIVAIPVFQLMDHLFIPTGRRSTSTPDHQGKIGLVCGYLDWDAHIA